MLSHDDKLKIAELAKDAHTDYEWGYDYSEALDSLKTQWPEETWEGEPWDEILDKPKPPKPYVRGVNPINDLLYDICAERMTEYLKNSTALLSRIAADDTAFVEGTTFTIPIRTNRNDV